MGCFCPSEGGPRRRPRRSSRYTPPSSSFRAVTSTSSSDEFLNKDLCNDGDEASTSVYVSDRSYSFCRVKFGVPLDQVCKKDIPGPLLVIIINN